MKRVLSGTVSLGKARSNDPESLPGMAMLQAELMDTSGKGPHGGILDVFVVPAQIRLR